MTPYSCSLAQFSPAAGRVGRCRQMSLCVGSTRRVLARQPAVLVPSPLVLRALPLRGEWLGWPGVCARSPQVLRAFFLCSEWPGQPGVCARPAPGAVCLFPSWRVGRVARGLAPSPRARRAFSLRGPSGSGLRKSLDRNRGLFAGWEGAASLGLSLPLAPPPSSYLQRGWGGSSLQFLSPFVLRTTRRCVPAGQFFSRSHTV